jgi:hypothetical protein
MTARDDFLLAMTKQFSDEGKLIEAGWVGLMAAAIPADAPPRQIREMRMAFMAGAQHLFASIMALDGGEDATEADTRRLELIAKELEVFHEEIRREARFAERKS